LRTARYRTVNALRLAFFAIAGLGALAVLALTLTGGLGAAGQAASSAFASHLTRSGYVVRAVDVVGGHDVTAAEIAAVIGAEPGTGLIDIDPAQARAAIEAMTRVESAQVVCSSGLTASVSSLPNGRPMHSGRPAACTM